MPEDKNPKGKEATNEEKRLVLLNSIKVIMNNAGGIESNIGITSEYWDLMRQYRRLLLEVGIIK